MIQVVAACVPRSAHPALEQGRHVRARRAFDRRAAQSLRDADTTISGVGVLDGLQLSGNIVVDLFFIIFELNNVPACVTRSPTSFVGRTSMQWCGARSPVT
jgi:hypothetical protein